MAEPDWTPLPEGTKTAPADWDRGPDNRGTPVKFRSGNIGFTNNWKKGDKDRHGNILTEDVSFTGEFDGAWRYSDHPDSIAAYQRKSAA